MYFDICLQVCFPSPDNMISLAQIHRKTLWKYGSWSTQEKWSHDDKFRIEVESLQFVSSKRTIYGNMSDNYSGGGDGWEEGAAGTRCPALFETFYGGSRSRITQARVVSADEFHQKITSKYLYRIIDNTHNMRALFTQHSSSFSSCSFALSLFLLGDLREQKHSKRESVRPTMGSMTLGKGSRGLILDYSRI